MDTKIRFDDTGLSDLGADFIDDDLKQTIIRCIDAQKLAAAEKISRFIAEPKALEKVSGTALNAILEQKRNIHGIATDSSIANGISFGSAHIDGAIIDESVEKEKANVDLKIARKLKDIFVTDSELQVVNSGHFWYPEESYMSWHTNSKVPGWRVYVNYAEEEGESFFRYQDPGSKEIVTLEDKHWNVRVFKITDEQPFWHCVYSNTNRFSLGYMVKVKSPPQSLLSRIKGKLRLK
ncbi:MAG: hypothetical protein ACJASY_002370 [Halioglobus sp.]